MSHSQGSTAESSPPVYVKGGRDDQIRHEELSIAVLVPCLNEEHAVGAVVRGFVEALPNAQVFVYDNGSSDRTVEIARAAGAKVHFEPRRGKGNVVRRMFADIDADVYVLVDGDGTYDASRAPEMVDRLVSERLDMVTGSRVVDDFENSAYRRGHVTGNAVFTKAVRTLFHGQFSDVLSGYRVMSRRFVKSLPMFSSGFEIETELCAHADRMRAATAEMPTAYKARHEESSSKLRTVRDGVHILLAMIRLVEETRPLQFFAAVFVLLTIISLALGIPCLEEFAHTGRVPRLPSAVLAVSIQIIAFLALTAGAILRSVARTRDEIRQMMYLQMEPTHLGQRLRD